MIFIFTEVSSNGDKLIYFLKHDSALNEFVYCQDGPKQMYYEGGHSEYLVKNEISQFPKNYCIKTQMLGGPKAPLVWNSVSNLIFDTYCFWQFSWVLEIHQSARRDK